MTACVRSVSGPEVSRPYTTPRRCFTPSQLHIGDLSPAASQPSAQRAFARLTNVAIAALADGLLDDPDRLVPMKGRLVRERLGSARDACGLVAGTLFRFSILPDGPS